MLWDLCIGQFGHGCRRPCGAAYTGGIILNLQGMNTKFQSASRTAGPPIGLPVRSRVVEGWVGGSLEVNDPWPAALTPLLLVVIAGEGGQQRWAAACRRLVLVAQARRGPAGTDPGDRCGGGAHFSWDTITSPDVSFPLLGSIRVKSHCCSLFSKKCSCWNFNK